MLRTEQVVVVNHQRLQVRRQMLAARAARVLEDARGPPGKITKYYPLSRDYTADEPCISFFRILDTLQDCLAVGREGTDQPGLLYHEA